MDKQDMAIERLKTASEISLQTYQKPLLITTSGGKDSSVCTELAKIAEIPFEVLHNHTTADAPETVYFVRKELYRLELMGIKCNINYPTYKGQRVSMWSLIPQKKIPPTRLVRYCCSVLKEQGGRNRFITTGVRWAESIRRKNNRSAYEKLGSSIKTKMLLTDQDDVRETFEGCGVKAKLVCNPIIDWSDDEVWSFLKTHRVKLNPLYEEGFNRAGCVGCPMAGRKQRQEEFRRWPKYKDMWLGAFDRMLKCRQTQKIPTEWQTAKDVFKWWMDYDVLPGQIDFDEMMEVGGYQ